MARSMIGSATPGGGGKSVNKKLSDKNLSYYAMAYFESIGVSVSGREIKDVLSEFYGDISIGMVHPKYFPPEAAMLKSISMDKTTAKRLYEKRMKEWDAQTIEDLKEKLAIQEETKLDKVFKFASSLGSKLGGALKKSLAPKTRESGSTTSASEGAAGSGAAPTRPTKNITATTVTELSTAPKGSLEDRLEAGSSNKEITELLKKIESNTSGTGDDKKKKEEKEEKKGSGIIGFLLGSLVKLGGPIAGLISLSKNLFKVGSLLTKGLVGIVKVVWKLSAALLGFVAKLTGPLLKGIVSAIPKVAGAAAKVGGSVVKGAAKYAAKAFDYAKDKIKTAKIGKGIGKSLLKKIPGIGLVAGLGFAAGKAMQGDFVGAGMEAASGAASLVPGLGTAASVAIDAASALRDSKREEAEEAKRSTPAKAMAAENAPVVETKEAMVEPSQKTALPELPTVDAKVSEVTPTTKDIITDYDTVAAAGTNAAVTPKESSVILPVAPVVAKVIQPLEASSVTPSIKTASAIFSVPVKTLLERVSGTITKSMNIVNVAKEELKTAPVASTPISVTNQTNNNVQGSGGRSSGLTGMGNSRPSLLPYEEQLISSMLAAV